MSRIKGLNSIFLIILLLSFSTASAQISIIPHGTGVSMEQNDEVDTELILINDYEDPVAFSIDYDLIEDEERRNGPRRDDPGELLGQFQSPINNIGGMAFDGELLWACSYGSDRLVAMTLEGEEVHNVGINQDPLSMTFDGELLWCSQWNSGAIHRYDLEGNRVDQFNMNFNEIAGIGSDQDEFVYMHARQEQRIHVEAARNQSRSRVKPPEPKTVL